MSPSAQPQAAAAGRAPARGPTRRAILALAALDAAAGLPVGSAVAGSSGAEDSLDPAPRHRSLARYSNIQFIFSHAGDAIPALAGRLAAMPRARKDLAAIAPQGIVAELAKLHYDTANAYSRRPWPRC